MRRERRKEGRIEVKREMRREGGVKEAGKGGKGQVFRFNQGQAGAKL